MTTGGQLLRSEAKPSHAWRGDHFAPLVVTLFFGFLNKTAKRQVGGLPRGVEQTNRLVAAVLEGP
jgi:hypothetical protein